MYHAGQARSCGLLSVFSLKIFKTTESGAMAIEV